MTYLQLTYLHLATILPAFVIATFVLCRRKGTRLHKLLGRVFLVLMLTTAAITLFMPAQVGPRLLNHFGFIHGFSLLVFYSAPRAYFAARRGDIRAHRGNMIGLYVGAILIAGAFAFIPGRMLHGLLFNVPPPAPMAH